MHSMSYSSGQQQSSSSNSRNSKLDQIIQNFYSKTAQIIIQARNTDRNYGKRSKSSTRKVNKWFNIATDDVDVLREDLKFWRTMAVSSNDNIPHMIIDIYLDTSRLANNQQQSLVLADDNLRWTKVELKSPTMGLHADRILIESWELSLNHPIPDHPIDLPNLYKRSIVFFRSLHSFVRLLPTYELYRKIYKQQADTNSLSMGYRLSSSSSRTHSSEISLNTGVLESDARSVTKTHEFKEIVTPIGTFKLNVTYRRNCGFRVEDSERDLSAQFIEMDEQFFTPTMMQYSNNNNNSRHQKDEKKPRPMSMYASISSNNDNDNDNNNNNDNDNDNDGGVGLGIRNKTPSPSSSSSLHRHSHLQSLSPIISRNSSNDASSRETSSSPSNRYSSPPQTIAGAFQKMETPSFASAGATSSRRSSAPFISPFKSPSLSSSPQAGAIAIKPRQPPSSTHPFQRGGGESGSFGKKLEFSSSFDKYKTSPRERRGSRASDHSSLLYFSENNDDGSSDLEDFVKLVGAHQQLKLFQEQPMDESMTSSLYRSKQQLSHFQNLRDTHASLSESITSSQHQETGVSPVSSTSSAGGRSSYQPVVPSPLHTAEAKKPMTPSSPMMPRSYPQTRTLASTSKALRDARRSIHSPLDIRSLKGDSEDEDVDDDDQDSYHTRDISAYSTYPTDRHYDMHHMRSGTSTQQGSSRQSHKSGSSSAADSDVEKSSNIGDKKGNDGKKKKKITLESRIAAPMDIQQQKRSNSNNNNSSSMLDDDDSLVFKMSELGYDDSPVGSTTAEPLLFNRAVASDNKNKKKEEGTSSPLTQSRLLFDAW